MSVQHALCVSRLCPVTTLNLLSDLYLFIRDKMEVEAPLDLSVTSSRVKLEYCTDDSDDSDGHGPNADPNCKAYKKSLMKRYCEYIIIPSGCARDHESA